MLPTPAPDIDTDEEGPEEGEEEALEDGDFLGDFPDDTEVCRSVSTYRHTHRSLLSV